MIGEIVHHKLFGDGEIIQVVDGSTPYEKYITVKFAAGDKKFVFPTIFGMILSAQSEALQQEIDAAKEAIENEKIKAREAAIAKREAEKAEAEAQAQAKAARSIRRSSSSAPTDLIIGDKLVKGKVYGTAAKTIFLACCNAFGWDETEQKHFGWQTPNYSEIATPEGYSVWFLAHSDWTGTDITDIKNKVGYSTVEQWWVDPSHLKAKPRKRIIFAKRDGHYEFLGIFKVADTERSEIAQGKMYSVETFNLMSEHYPEE